MKHALQKWLISNSWSGGYNSKQHFGVLLWADNYIKKWVGWDARNAKKLLEEPWRFPNLIGSRKTSSRGENEDLEKDDGLGDFEEEKGWGSLLVGGYSTVGEFVYKGIFAA